MGWVDESCGEERRTLKDEKEAGLGRAQLRDRASTIESPYSSRDYLAKRLSDSGLMKETLAGRELLWYNEFAKQKGIF